MDTDNSFEIVKKLMLERRSVRKYLPKEIPSDELKEVLELAKKAPSSYNMQPYKVVVVRTPNERKKLSKCMLMSNGKIVMNAPVTLVVCCDLQPTKSLTALTQLEIASGMSKDKIGAAEKLFPGSLKKENWFTHTKEAFTGSYKQGVHNSTEGWAYKNSALFMQQFVMLAQSKGWGTVYMGGIDAKSIKSAFGIPSRYDVCCTIAVGYPDDSEKYHEHPRLPPQIVVYENNFGESPKTEIKEVKQTYFWKSS